MLILPAIDLKDGQCVRLYKGNMNEATVYSKEPAEVALRWEKMGARYLHLVDLDGAISGSPKNLEAIKKIISNVNIPVQLGGGIRSIETMEHYFKLGISRLIIGTAALKNPQLVEAAVDRFGAGAIVLGLDSKLGNVAVDGWETVSEKSAIEFALQMAKLGIERIVYTDTLRDGTLEGLNIEGITEMAVKTGIKIIASGGVAGIEDVTKVKELQSIGVEGLIIGKALYTGDINLEEAISIAGGQS
ncbi:MAG: 1-(5-phosphoribosyl)-5-((5-phosphoribosylamino)methylideneamino)imidazole-4-carboxamide isomerase [Desulfitibacter sp. BRH_c19]|nr:MAG: 1-(5-phosphoribosyl)-5-((5-phosphoribosylamino)methylideneamino)imidazole-4-carboxamide isomerase [Desulfitibacter sp. BRH_c19]